MTATRLENDDLQCDHCGTVWNENDYVACPTCNAAVFAAVDKIERRWLDDSPQAGDVLDITFGDDGRMIIKKWNLYQR